MKQLYVQGANVVVVDVPNPPLDPRGVLVETTAAAISVGTEARRLRTSRQPRWRRLTSASVRQKALKHLREGTLWPAAQRQFGHSAPTAPPRNWLGDPTGYSCAGRVLAVGEQVTDLQPGDRVACAGSPHAEIVAVPRNLLVPTPAAVTDLEASFVALGSIALHAVRQAQLTTGETAVIMGMGMIGQLVDQLARASGARTVATDLVPQRLELARRLGTHLTIDVGADDLAARVLTFTSGVGADAVILCMAGDSPEPVKQALEIVRDRGRLVIVGTPRLEIPRQPFYRKEVELRIARSYGPGRYDPAYEEEGHDYPLGYVRWTEQRNMAEFLRLVAEQKVDVASLVTHVFALEHAAQAYEVAAGDPSTSLGVVLATTAADTQVHPLREPPQPERQIGVAVVGAGAFARAYHLPNVNRIANLKLHAIVTRRDATARHMADEFGAQVATTDFERVLHDPSVELVILATPHNLHAAQSVAALEAGKAVFCEKPMGMNSSEVEQVVAAVERTGGFYATGYNRRYAPTVVRARELLAGRKGPLVLSYRVMGSFLPADHWVYDPVRGGGRVVGEMCHFFDLLYYLVGGQPVQVTTTGGTLSHPGTNLHDNLACTLAFDDGSIASLVYGDLGQPQLPKERLEIFAGEGVLLLDDFVELAVHGFSGQRGVRLARADKGHRALLEAVVAALRAERPSPVDAQEGQVAMNCAFGVVDQLKRASLK